MSKFKWRLVPALALASLVALTGCVAYPAGYGYGEAGGYYAPSATVVIPAPVYRPYYGGYRGGWGRGGRW
jgi:hypothetical protein